MTPLHQVRKTISQYHLIHPDETIVLGVSGGPDSLVLAHLLRALRDEWHFRIHIAHLNHQLRGSDADADADFVAWLAREWNLPATIEARDVAAHARGTKLSIEQAAREVRYAFLAKVAQKVGAHTIAVAHHADDQVETVLMHLLRGAGMAGLRGMAYASNIQSHLPTVRDANFKLIRPLLDVTRVQIETYCRDNALNPRFDLSNLDTTLFRNRIRHEVLPILETLNPNLREVLRRTARSLADDCDFFQAQVNDAFRHVAKQDRGAIIFEHAAWGALHPSLQRGTLRVAIEQLRQSLRGIVWAHIEDARMIALEKNAGAEATLPRGLRLTVGYGEFFIADRARAGVGFDLPQLSVERIALPHEGVIDLPGSEWVAEVSRGASEPESANAGEPWSELFAAEKVRGEIFLRRRKPGDKFQPVGMNGHRKSLHEFMIDEKIPQMAREPLPLLVDAEKILWVCGYRIDERARVTEASREVVRVVLRKKETFN